jgi:hypothetical protein
MAYLYRTGMDLIKFKEDSEEDMVLHVKNDGKVIYTRILLNMPYHTSDNNLVLDTERFI